jgi:hypothetical protein
MREAACGRAGFTPARPPALPHRLPGSNLLFGLPVVMDTNNDAIKEGDKVGGAGWKGGGGGAGARAALRTGLRAALRTANCPAGCAVGAPQLSPVPVSPPGPRCC